jgi:NTP pyrophosphatase (non-canonical NTP hydrolase)
MSVDRIKLAQYGNTYSSKYMDETVTRMIKEVDYKALIIAMEELAELIQAVSKMMRFNDGPNNMEEINKRLGWAGDDKGNLIEEYGDVIIALNTIKKKYNVNMDEVNQMIAYKLDKLNGKMDEGSLANI